ncbi:MAG: hypothetical protein ACWA5P_07560 [bacterium]
MKQLLIIGLFISFIGCKDLERIKDIAKIDSVSPNTINLPDSLSTRRVSFVLNLKKSLADSIWPNFGEKRNEGPIIYFDGEHSEVFYPDTTIGSKLLNNKNYNKEYALLPRIDARPFHMEVMLSYDHIDSSKYFYENPVEQYSSVEEVHEYIPSVKSTEMWSTMVLHEMFHHFQYNHKNFEKYARNKISVLPFHLPDLISLSTNDSTFLKMIQTENDFLLKAIQSKNGQQKNEMVIKYLNARKSRINKYSKTNPHLEIVENYYVLQEGSARYLEHQAMLILSNFARNKKPIIKKDALFKSYTEFENFNIESKVFDYLTYAGASDYHYTLGFNTMRLLDQLSVNYKNKLLHQPEKALSEYLEDYISNLADNR